MGARTLDPPLRSIFLPFQAILSTFCFFQTNLGNRPPWGQGGPPICFFTPNLIFLCDLKPHAEFGNLTITPSDRKVTTSEVGISNFSMILVDT